MKKKLLFSILLVISLFAIIGCGKKSEEDSKERTMEYLLDKYIVAYSEADWDAVNDIYPSFYLEYSKEYFTKEYLEDYIKEAKEIYGDDISLTYDIVSSTKMNEIELEKLNSNLSAFYDAKDKVSECYKYDVTLHIKGSKNEQDQEMLGMGYCKINDVWYLVSVD